jgi:hypothetical protein
MALKLLYVTVTSNSDMRKSKKKFLEMALLGSLLRVKKPALPSKNDACVTDTFKLVKFVNNNAKNGIKMTKYYSH